MPQTNHTTEVSIPCSVGELFDKFSILMIKKAKISDPVKLKHIQEEMDKLDSPILKGNMSECCLKRIYECNWKCWENNDLRRQKVTKGELDQEFLDMCLLEMSLNDQRFLLKKEINEVFNSVIQEQKSHL